MTDTITTQPARPVASPVNLRLHPADVLMNLIVTLLAPMFIAVCGGDIEYARMAATETVNGYRSRDNGDLIAIAQIIACGLAALGSLSLSMADDLTIAMTLRLRGNANALNRSAEQNRRAVRENHRADATPDHSQAPDPAEVSEPIQAPPAPEAQADPEQEKFEAEVLARAADTRKLVAYAQARAQDLKSAAEPAQTATPTTATPMLTPTNPTDQEIQAMWAAAMADVADEFTAELPNLPPAEREMATRRVAALSHCANELILGTPSIRPKPGDLDALMPHPSLGR